ncbi:eukaryotic translation initiation factor 3 subunit E [Ceraceosorus guamensis]|uniref:Eukaryotic translation initiation factor 3 subunit E n=1 Tax=Ceraceosorus guamensis TaxID=1522189 RepID=A0A316VRM6_9BASI|nr:eukaryotic translation initiation factor 3 subunit E [Ceraceosorus guamensis]PWN40256.1 eukaryotic translation initiation factor 3 subunit E [Ceraceosorus guamensis]
MTSDTLAPSASASPIAYDLTPTVLKYVDRHLAFPLLSHMASTEQYKQDDIAKAQYELAKGTSMVDYALMLHEQAFPDQPAPAELEQQRAAAEKQNEKLAQESEKVLNVIEDPSVAASLKQDKVENLRFLEKNYDLNEEQINALYHYGHFHFACGNYGEASSYLYHFRVLSVDPNLTLSSHWGKLASDILTGSWDDALSEINLLREALDSGAHSDGGQEGALRRRTWLLHWSLFVFFNHPEGRVGLVEMFLAPAYINTMQTSAWWLLRYLVAAVIMTRRSVRIYSVQSNNGLSKVSPTAALRDVTRMISQESHRLQADPLVDFVKELYTDFDFEAAQDQLSQAQKVANDDFFLQEHADSFVEAARFLVSEIYCRIHQQVDIADLSTRLNMSKEEGEKWVVNLIRDTRADAKIDFNQGIVHMNQTHPPIYQSVIEKTRGFSFRTSAMGQAIDRKAHPVAPGSENATRGGRGGGRGGRGAGRGGRGGGGAGRTGQRDGESAAAEGNSAAPAAASANGDDAA